MNIIFSDMCDTSPDTIWHDNTTHLVLYVCLNQRLTDLILHNHTKKYSRGALHVFDLYKSDEVGWTMFLIYILAFNGLTTSLYQVYFKHYIGNIQYNKNSKYLDPAIFMNDTLRLAPPTGFGWLIFV